ncbi:hypothetical protein KKC52_07220 [bacterium]|nr:hypothetical protein [bacterium]
MSIRQGKRRKDKEGSSSFQQEDFQLEGKEKTVECASCGKKIKKKAFWKKGRPYCSLECGEW